MCSSAQGLCWDTRIGAYLGGGGGDGGGAADIDYKTNPQVKPPYSYATLICMAMEASEKPKITLSAIYKWITDNFCYFRHADPTWQNSIRHNLSLNKCFIKVPREKGEPGKGGFWKLDPQYANRLKNSAFKNGGIGKIQFWGWFILSLFKGLFCKPALQEGGFLQQQQQHGKDPGIGPGRNGARCSQNWLLSFLHPKSLLWLLKGLNHHEPSLPFTPFCFFAPRLLLSTSSAHPSGSERPTKGLG
uniref:Uncharacterized protein n=1 Tax=Melopsittacus undulatus TaxID=13146 RepID=A0A8V5HJD8_MELUD